MSVSKLISPGVFTRENDLSFVPAGISEIGATVVGLCQKGPAFVPTIIDSFETFRERFGNLNEQFYTPYAAKSYLANASTLTVTRILSNTTSNIGNPIVIAFPVSGVTGSGVVNSSNTATAILRFRSDGALSANINGSVTNFSLSAGGSVVNNLSLDPGSVNYIKKILGTDPLRVKSGDQLTSVYVDAVFDYLFTSSGFGAVSGAATANTNSFNQFIDGYFTGTSPWIVSQNYNGSVYNLLKFYSRSDGDASNYDVKVSVLVDSTQVSVSSFPMFTVFIRDYNDSDRRPLILESFRCNLDPNSNAFIGRVIGDRYVSVDNSTDPPTLKIEGTYENNSKYVRVEVAMDGNNILYPPSAKPSGYQGVQGINPGTAIAQLPYRTNHLNNITGVRDDKFYMGVDFDKSGISDRIKGSIVSVSGAKHTDKGILTFSVSSEYIVSSTASLTASYILAPSWGAITESSTSFAPSVSSTFQRNSFTVPLAGGADGFDPRLDKRELLNSSLSTELDYAIDLLGNADEYDFNLIAVPGVNAGNSTNGNTPQRIIDMVEDRGDAFYIMDVADSNITSTSGALESTVDGVVNVISSYDTSYAATYFPWVRILDPDSQKLIWVPPSVDVLGVYSFNDRVGQQFFAPAGYNRGVMSAVESRLRLNITQRDTLYANRVNPIGTFSGQGPVVWGQKTLQVKASALDRVNVRRLLILAKKLVASVAKFYAFEPNTSRTRTELTNQINPILRRIQENQGIEEFRVDISDTLNNQDVIDRNVLIGKIYLIPVRSAEILQFEFNILRSGSTLFES